MITDVKGGRDYTNNIDRNGQEKSEIIKILGRNIPENILEILTNNIRESGIKDITEYGRVVHAEMDAILGCARRGVSSKDTEMFCSTFPCHNCAKHIIASGIKHVVYIEPYPKSKALDMHSDAICVPDNHNKEGKVLFSPFVGVGPRIMINLFSLCLSTGEKVRRKSPNSYQKAEWNRSTARPRLKAFTTSYMENENRVKEEAHDLIATIEKIEIKNQEYI